MRVIVGDGQPIEAPNDVIKLTEEGCLFHDWLQANRTAVVVVRPDRYVFGAADRPDELNELVGKLIEGLTASESGRG